MGSSRTVRVVVSPKSADLTISLNPADGPPGTVKIEGMLTEGYTPIEQRTIELWVNGLKKTTTKTSSLAGRRGEYWFDYTVGVGSYDFYTRFPGDATYMAVDSDLRQGTYSKIGTDLTIDVNPMYGRPPLAVTIMGQLTDDDTGWGLNGKSIKLYRNEALIKSYTTVSTPGGAGFYVFHDTLSAAGGYDYRTHFAGDSKYEGCEVSDGAIVTNGEPPNGEPPVDAGAGLGILLLALLVMSE